MEFIINSNSVTNQSIGKWTTQYYAVCSALTAENLLNLRYLMNAVHSMESHIRSDVRRSATLPIFRWKQYNISWTVGARASRTAPERWLAPSLLIWRLQRLIMLRLVVIERMGMLMNIAIVKSKNTFSSFAVLLKFEVSTFSISSDCILWSSPCFEEPRDFRYSKPCEAPNESARKHSTN